VRRVVLESAVLRSAGVRQEPVRSLMRGVLGRGRQRDVVAVAAWLVLVQEEPQSVRVALGSLRSQRTAGSHPRLDLVLQSLDVVASWLC
jgi:hypothetical protein